MTQPVISKELFARRFSELLEESGESLTQVAQTVSLSTATVCRYALGKMAPKTVVAQAIAEHFRVNPDWLMGKSEERSLPKDELRLDDFTYALHNETKELSEENKQKLLEMARLFRLSQEYDSQK